MSKFTTMQQLAIDSDGQNILVSAGAGSGKTSVLTARVIRKLKQGNNIDQLIILTFTNAAASEMKQRIKKAIQQDSSLHGQLAYLDNAIISTFDSFAARIVSQYHYYLGRSSQEAISDPIFIQFQKEQLISSIINRHFDKSNPTFIEVMNRLFDKGDKLLHEGLGTLLKGLERLPDPIQYIDNYEQRFLSDEAINHQLERFTQQLLDQ
ncbi:MAG: UvrD-helicase domain-containing protein, partial [bacterium]|nr:UvrD-helicase domain-containing protein [bacterium]